MADSLSQEQRSILMSKVRSSDTKPEWILRCALHRFGLRYNLKNKHLPGNPDLVFPKYRTVVFVHGCFWHRHAGCKDASMPKSNRSFWTKKLRAGGSFGFWFGVNPVRPVARHHSAFGRRNGTYLALLQVASKRCLQYPSRGDWLRHERRFALGVAKCCINCQAS